MIVCCLSYENVLFLGIYKEQSKGNIPYSFSVTVIMIFPFIYVHLLCNFVSDAADPACLTRKNVYLRWGSTFS